MEDYYGRKSVEKNKNGMAMLMLFIALYVAAIAAIVSGAMMTETAEASKPVIAIILIVVGVVYVGLGWIFFLGLKVLKPQEALVLTLLVSMSEPLRMQGFIMLIHSVQQLIRQRKQSLTRVVM